MEEKQKETNNNNDNINIVKQTCKEFNLSYKELGEKIGFNSNSLRTIASQRNVSLQIERAINLFRENEKLKQREQKLKEFFNIMKELNTTL